jgi:hypothetical protein
MVGHPHQQVLLNNPEVLGSIPGATKYSAYQWVCKVVPFSPLSLNEELLERKLAASI